ncbi:HAD-IA family hydrolase [Gordonia sp. TBRC 11910]|uniref:HAD-IA family hydrolase n=1 Tax=Gordonia asplenii TaxID=2725283 RepID=A0A848KVU0_9ACTN|nr:HAD-IA family hydrolase [Gordonia asplenii]NMO02399.1 HAD-IA family hydrolase [Gordonia asplenii]
MTASTFDAVLFDFSGTLFRFTENDEWFADLHDESGDDIDIHTQAELVRRMTQPVGLPADLPDDARIAWKQRDLDPAQHRRAYLAMLRRSGLSVPGHAESLYERVLDPASWQPYPDTVDVLKALSDIGIRVGVVSNIAFDLRDVLARYGLRDLVDYYALSYEVGAIKPDVRLFRAAIDALGVEADRTLMVGDSEEADGGSRALGCAFALVEPLPTAERPRGLVDALAAHGFSLS